MAGGDGSEFPGVSRRVLVGVVLLLSVVAGGVVVDTSLLGLPYGPDQQAPQAPFELDRGERIRLVHTGGDTSNSSRLVVSRNDTWNSTWTALAGREDARTVSERDAVPPPDVGRGERISLRYVDGDVRTLLFRARV